MAATFPGGVKQFPVINPGDPILSSTENAQQEEIVAIETEYRRMGLHNLADPGADRVLFWDDSAGALKWLTVDGIVDTAFGQWQNWTPTQTGWTSGTVTGTFKYSVIGNIVFLLIDMTAGTSNATNAYIDLPVNADLNASYGGALGMAIDNGTVLTQAAKWYIGGTSQTIAFNTDMSNGAWTASGTKRVRCLAIYAKGT